MLPSVVDTVVSHRAADISLPPYYSGPIALYVVHVTDGLWKNISPDDSMHYDAVCDGPISSFGIIAKDDFIEVSVKAKHSKSTSIVDRELHD